MSFTMCRVLNHQWEIESALNEKSWVSEKCVTFMTREVLMYDHY